MKTSKVISLFFSLPILLLSSLSAQENEQGRFIEVTGSAQLSTQPDELNWSVSLFAQAATLQEASQIVNETEQALKQALTEAGLPEQALRLSTISSMRHYRQDENRNSIPDGFKVSRKVLIKTASSEKREQVEAILLQQESISIDNFWTSSSKHDELRREVILEAAKAARSKAEDLAEVLGAQLGEALQVYQGENSSGYSTWSNRNINLSNNFIFPGQSAEGGSEEVDSLRFNAEVRVKFALK